MLDDLGLSGLIDCIFITLGKLEGLICTVLSFVSDVLDDLDLELSGLTAALLSCILITFEVLVELEFNSGSLGPIEAFGCICPICLVRRNFISICFDQLIIFNGCVTCVLGSQLQAEPVKELHGQCLLQRG